MKKCIYIFVALVTLVLSGTKVEAIGGKHLANCIYKGKIDVAGEKDFKLTIGIFDDESLSGINNRPTSIYKGLDWQFEKKFEKKFLEKVYPNKVLSTCPKLKFCNFSNVDLKVYTNVNTSCPDMKTTVVDGKLIVIDDNTAEPTVIEYCSTTKRLRNHNYQIKIEFYSINDQKMYRITHTNESSMTAEAKVNELIELNKITYSVANDIVEKVYKTNTPKSCGQVYLKTEVSMSNTFMTIQSTKPEDFDNGSYNMDDAEDDDGSDEDGSDDDESDDEEGITTIRKCISCGGAELPASLPVFSRALITTVQVLVPVIMIVMGIVTLIKAMISGEDKVFSSAKTSLIRKVIAGVMIFLVIAIVKFIFSLFGGDAESSLSCVTCFTSDESACTFVACPKRNMGNKPSDSEVGPNPGGGGGGSSSPSTPSGACTSLSLSSCSSRSDCEQYTPEGASTPSCRSKCGNFGTSSCGNYSDCEPYMPSGSSSLSCRSVCSVLTKSECNTRSDDCDWRNQRCSEKTSSGSSSIPTGACSSLSLESCAKRSDCKQYTPKGASRPVCGDPCAKFSGQSCKDRPDCKLVGQQCTDK